MFVDDDFELGDIAAPAVPAKKPTIKDAAASILNAATGGHIERAQNELASATKALKASAGLSALSAIFSFLVLLKTSRSGR